MDNHLGYELEASEGFISDVTDKILPQIEDWQNRPLSSMYPIIFIDAIHFSVREDGLVRKLAAYIVLGINENGMKEVLTIKVGENETSKYWLSILNSLKNHGVQDILILCSDGLSGLKEAIATADPKTEHQRCIVHLVHKKWSPQYPNSIESLNSSYRRLNRQRSVFPSFQAFLKALYLATFESTKKWTMPIRNWGKVRGELAIMFQDRIPD